MKVTGDWVLIKLDEKASETTSSGGIIVPTLHEDPPMFGTVVEIGDGDLVEKLFCKWDEDGKMVAEKEFVKRPIDDIAVGDRVVFPRWSGMETEVDGEKYIFIKHNHIIAVVVED